MFPGVEFLRTLSRFKKRKENLSLCIYVIHKTSHWEVSRRSRTVKHSKECTKKRDARAELLICS